MRFGEGFNSAIELMLGVVVALLGGFAFLVWRSYRTGARRYAALIEMQRKERNQLDPP